MPRLFHVIGEGLELGLGDAAGAVRAVCAGGREGESEARCTITRTRARTKTRTRRRARDLEQDQEQPLVKACPARCGRSKADEIHGKDHDKDTDKNEDKSERRKECKKIKTMST